jgi:signal transduction histidine kinase
MNEVFYQFSVKDNGPGIEPKNKDRIFQIFNTFSIGEKNPGTGIGLTIVKKIVEIYGGKITVESELNKGSEFIFTIDKQKVTAVMA